MAAFRDGQRWRALLSSPWCIGIALFVIGCVPRVIGLGDHPPRTDEIYHLIAGRSWAEHGTLALGAGSYERASLYSIATGIMFKLFGEGVAQGRLLAALIGGVQIALLGLWVRGIAGARGAWVAGLLFAFNYMAIEHARWARFYTAHGLACWLFAVAAFAMVTEGLNRGWARFAMLAVTALLSLAIAMHLQKMTPIIVAAILAWAGIWLLCNGRLGFFFGTARRATISIAIGVAGSAALLWLLREPLQEQWTFYRRAAAWALPYRDQKSFYIQGLAYDLNWMFALFPVAVMICWKRYRDAALFCAVIFFVSLIAHSFGGMKARRYIYYLYPFLIALWGLAFAVIIPAIAGWWREVVPERLARWRRVLALGAFGFAGALALICANDYRNTLVAFAQIAKQGNPDLNYDSGWAREEVDWTPYLPELRKLAAAGSLFVATDAPRTIYYLGDFDIMLNQSELSDMGDGEFVFDDRSGRWDIGSASALAKLMRCYASGSLLISDTKIASPDIPPDVWAMIRQRMREVPLPEPLHMRGFVWRGEADKGSAECRAIYDAGYVPGGERP